MYFIADYYKYFALIVLLITFFKIECQFTFKNVLAAMNVLMLLNTFMFIKTSWYLYIAFRQLHLSNTAYSWWDSFYVGKKSIYLLIEWLLPFAFLFKKLFAHKLLTTILLFALWSNCNIELCFSIFKFLNYTSLLIALYALLWLLKTLPSQQK
jgi:hypothetical protein